jgi:Mg-chelatase subunit ChlD
MVFVLDASTSVTEANYEVMKDFIKYFLLHAAVNTGDVRVGIIIYSTEDYLQFHLNAYTDKLEMYDAIDAMPYRHGSTNTADALRTMRTEMFTAANGDRPDVPNVAIVITDGVSNINARRTIPEAVEAQRSGITVYAIGIGLTDTTELDGIASKPVDEYRYSVKEFTDLRDLREKVFASLCSGSWPVFWVAVYVTVNFSHQ